MIIFGGNSDRHLNDTYEFHIPTRTWKKLLCTRDIPIPRQGHTAVVHKDCMIVFGGYDGQGCLNDLMSLNFINLQWKSIRSRGDIPCCRVGHSVAVSGNNMFLFGGYNGVNMNDLFKLDMNTFIWQKIIDVGQPPFKRRYHTSVVAPDGLYVFAGNRGFDRLDNSMFKLQWASHGFASKLLHIYSKSLLCDVAIRLDDGSEFLAHECILSQSKTLETAISNVNKKGSKRTVTLTEIRGNAFNKIIHYLYSGGIELRKSDAPGYVDLVLAAKRFQLIDLEIMLLRQFERIVDEKNVIDILCKAKHHGHDQLKFLCLKIFERFDKNCMRNREFLNLDKELLVELLLEKGKLEEARKKLLKNTTNGAIKLQEHIKSLYNSKKFSDITLISRDKKHFKAHRAILAAFSEYFRIMFSGAFAEAKTSELELNYVDSLTLELALEYIYKGTVKLPSDFLALTNLGRFADMTLMDDLNEVVNKKLLSMVSNSNALEILKFCIDTNFEGKLGIVVYLYNSRKVDGKMLGNYLKKRQE